VQLPPLRSPVVLAVPVLVLVVGTGVAGCGSPRQDAREDAVAAVRDKAVVVREELAAAARGTSGAAQLEAVRAALPDVPLTARSDGDGVAVTGAVTARAESGGGLSYEAFEARLCLRYAVSPQSGETRVADAPCPPDADTTAPADETVRLAD
jgi:hypothetical protein